MATKSKSVNGDVGSWSDKPDVKDRSESHLQGMEAAAAKAAKENRAPTVITLPPLDIKILHVRIVGESPLICHRFSEKAIRIMLGKQMGEATAGREKKDPQADYESSLYTFKDDDGNTRYGFPAIAFKNAAVEACTSTGKSITKVAARQAFHVLGELVEIEGTPQMRQDMVRLASGVADVRFRGEFVEWAATLRIKYNARVLSPGQIINLINLAGFAVGVGEWRPEKNGQYGRFMVPEGT
jgi:hypothetical protein